ncbi:protein MCM10 homolog isoform X1 [Ipomoea triloba]|uniref:protein MCM10 homolog isoform X1 n=1 Tax=Ipomoea triloba TaxID=35885 RepID=UPI00125D0D9A|nr:protein MCM10 homolog isoform X1 [Ipomoea triloba]
MSDQEDLDLLLSLEDRVLETPPASPSSHSPDYLSDDERPKRVGQTDMSVFRVAVQDCLDYDTETAKKALKSKSNIPKASNDSEVEKFSGLRIRNQLVSPVELSNRFSDIRFVRLPAIKNLLSGDTLSGCWATVGVLTETGQPRTSSTGKPYAIWKMGCLKENTVSVFLFGDAYQRNSNEKAGAVFALFNCGVRNDNSQNGFSLSVYSASNILKMGTSVDYGVCKGKRKDGMACTLVINKRNGIYCSYHRQKTSEKYSVTRTELKGGNLRTAFRGPLKSEGIYMVDPLADKTNLAKNKAPVKLFSAEQLKEALSKAGKVTTNAYSQGIRFLNKITEESISSTKISTAQSQRISKTSERISLTKRKNPTQVKIGEEVHVHSKRSKSHEGTERVQQGQVKEKMIELDIVSSDDEL